MKRFDLPDSLTCILQAKCFGTGGPHALVGVLIIANGLYMIFKWYHILKRQIDWIRFGFASVLPSEANIREKTWQSVACQMTKTAVAVVCPLNDDLGPGIQLLGSVWKL